MILIGENIHVISKNVRNALINKNEDFIKELIQIQSTMDYIDLNVGPARGELSGVLSWLSKIVQENSKVSISFDSTNSKEIAEAIEFFSGDTFINSASSEEERLNNMTDIALKYGSNLIALTLSKDSGIPKTSDGRLEIAFEIYEKCLEKGISNEKLFFDPLVLPVCVDQGQGIETLNTLKMIKESFDPPVKTVIGLSNISNGCNKENRLLLNRVYATLAFGAGLDAVIVDARDLELIRILKMLENNSPKSEIDNLYVSLSEMMRDFSNLDDIDYDRSSKEQTDVIKTVRILLNKEIYTHSFTQI